MPEVNIVHFRYTAFSIFTNYTMTQIKTFKLAGLALAGKTTNANGQSGRDCGKLWSEFEATDMVSKIKNRLTDDVIAVYHQYEGNQMQSFSYFIGCKVSLDAEASEELDYLTIPEGVYQKISISGKMPDCMTNAWKEIQDADTKRAFTADYEIYGTKSQNWHNAEIEIMLSVLI